jgi:hypothetical protein
VLADVTGLRDEMRRNMSGRSGAAIKASNKHWEVTEEELWELGLAGLPGR